MKTQEEILSCFKDVKRSGSGWSARCTGSNHKHGDKNPSLSINFGKDGRFLAKCHCGCDFIDIIAGAGLCMADVSPDYEFKPYTWRERMEYGLKKNIGDGSITAIYDYISEDGYQYSKVRFQPNGKPKEIRYYQIDRKADAYTAGKGDGKACLYNLQRFLWAISRGQTVFYVEGEKDVDNLQKLGLTATTAGGTKDWRPEYAQFFKGAKLVILNDNDEAGRDHADQVQASVYNYAYWSQITQTSTEEKGDISDWLQNEGGTKEALLKLVDAGEKYDIRQYAPWLMVQKEYMFEDQDGNLWKTPPPDKPSIKVVVDVKLKLNPDDLAQTFTDGNSFLLLNNPIDDKRYFYQYHKGVYVRTNMQGVNGELKRYMPQGTASMPAIDNTRKLLTCGAYGRLCEYADLDTNERYINVRNGLYDIREKTLKPHSPKLRSTIQLQCQYDLKAEKPVFDKFIHEFCSDDEGTYNQQKEMLVQEFFGLAISNIDVSRVKKLLWLFSQQGDTGKSVVMHLASYILGGKSETYTANVPLQQMNEQSKFTIGSLLGKRLIAVGDQSATEITDTSLLKSLTGGDVIKIEAKNAQPIYMHYRGAIMIASNTLPSIGGGDKGIHLFDRFMFIPCEHHVTGKQADRNLREKLHAEMDGIFSWSIEGLHRLIDNNYQFTRCTASEDVVTEYRQMQDTLYRFITEAGYEITHKSDDRQPRKDFEEEYCKFCLDNNLTPLKKGFIKNRMLSFGCGCRDAARVNGKVCSCYTGISKCWENDLKTPTFSQQKPQHLPDPETFEQISIDDEHIFD